MCRILCNCISATVRQITLHRISRCCLGFLTTDTQRNASIVRPVNKRCTDKASAFYKWIFFNNQNAPCSHVWNVLNPWTWLLIMYPWFTCIVTSSCVSCHLELFTLPPILKPDNDTVTPSKVIRVIPYPLVTRSTWYPRDISVCIGALT